MQFSDLFNGKVLVFLLVLLLYVYILRALKIASRKNDLISNAQINTTGILLAIWLIVIAFVAQIGFFTNFSGIPPRIAIVVIFPLLVIFFLLFDKNFFKVLKSIPPAWLIKIQAFRIIMELFLWMGYKDGYVPEQMTFEWLNFDIIIGLTAPIAAYVFFYKGRLFKNPAILWNIFGLILLVNIMFIAMTSTPSPLRLFFNEPANTFVAEFPFIWIPGFIVPFAVAMHLFSIRQLISMK